MGSSLFEYYLNLYYDIAGTLGYNAVIFYKRADMSYEVLDSVYELIKQSPHASQSLMLFALLKTLDIEKGGHMYTLAKLKDMTPESRQMAYALMELMAENKIHDEHWRTKVELIETTIRSNS